MISAVAEKYSIHPQTLRLYEREGLLAPSRSEGGFRLYSSNDLSTLQFIRKLQSLGFSLNEMRDFLTLRTNDLRACPSVQKMLDHKLRDARAKRIAFMKPEVELRAALRKCNSQLSHPHGRDTGMAQTISRLADDSHQRP